MASDSIELDKKYRCTCGSVMEKERCNVCYKYLEDNHHYNPRAGHLMVADQYDLVCEACWQENKTLWLLG